MSLTRPGQDDEYTRTGSEAFDPATGMETRTMSNASAPVAVLTILGAVVALLGLFAAGEIVVVAVGIVAVIAAGLIAVLDGRRPA